MRLVRYPLVPVVASELSSRHCCNGGEADGVAGQMVNLPTVVRSTKTNKLDLLSITKTTTEDGTGRNVPADEIKAGFNHTFEFRTPLPSSLSQVTMDTSLFVYSTDKGIVRFADRPQDQIPDNAVLSVSHRFLILV